MSKAAWTGKDITSQNGKLAIVTGGTGGLGFETSLALAKAGATVILAGRNETKGTEALSKIKSTLPDAKISFGKVDLGSFASVKQFATEFLATSQALDILINNAGIMAPPKREITSDGLEIQMQTNHLAHFALTAQLLPALMTSSSPRVVNVSSIAARRGTGKMNFDDLQSEKNYSPTGAYNQSKLANLLFTFELQRRSTEGNWGINAIAAHPGISKTELVVNGMGQSIVAKLYNCVLKPLCAQTAADGAWAILFAATAEDAQPGGYYGPNGCYEMKGPVCPAYIPPAANDLDAAKKLWDISVTLTNVTWP